MKLLGQSKLDTLSGFFLREIYFDDWISHDDLKHSPFVGLPRLFYLDELSLEKIDSWKINKEDSLVENSRIVSWHSQCYCELFSRRI